MAVADVAHEGSHVSDFESLMHSNFSSALNITNRASEHSAYAIEDSVLRSYGYRPAYQGFEVDLSSDRAIDNYLDSTPNSGENLNDPIYKR
jgi:hypothetical protein